MKIGLVDVDGHIVQRQVFEEYDKVRNENMLIETNPCGDCDFSPEFCSCDIEICQITRGASKPISEEQYEKEKLLRYTRYEYDGIRNREDRKMKQYYAMAKESFLMPIQEGIRPVFIKNQVYECLKLENGDFSIRSDIGMSIKIDSEYALEHFWIKGK